MQISQEPTSELTATIRIEITPDDYQEKVEKLLRDYRRKANIPGFRPGMVPFGMIKRMYGKAILTDEINKIIGESLDAYIKENNLELLGHPLASTEKNKEIDFDSQTGFDFYFDIGLSPKFELDLSGQIGVDYHSIVVDDEMLEGYIKDIREKHGKSITDEQGNEQKEPAELNEEFFLHMFPDGQVTTEADFREHIRKDVAASFVADSEKQFMNNVVEALIQNSHIALPDEFLKRYLLENNQDKLTPENIEEKYEQYAQSMKWQLIENKLIRDHQLGVSEAEIRNYIRSYFQGRFGADAHTHSHEHDHEHEHEHDHEHEHEHDHEHEHEHDHEHHHEDDSDPSRLNSLVDYVMKNEKEVRKINDHLFDVKLRELCKRKLTVNHKEVTFKEFIKIATEKKI
jgi:FKBP-type peptidyl-prolyl cis-trans isomerase (trigger factor)